MELRQLLPAIRELSSSDRRSLLQFLATDLVKESGLTLLNDDSLSPEAPPTDLNESRVA